MFVISKKIEERRASQLLGKRGFDYLIASIRNSLDQKTRLDVTDRDKRPAKTKKAACEPWRDSHAADRGYAAETRP